MRIRQRAFTLVEVILAILIISAIITVLLYFYQRSVEVRQAVLRETEYLSISRMFLEQLTGELRTARSEQNQFVGLEGTSNSLSFIYTSIPVGPRWIVGTNEAVPLAPNTDLKRVSYRLLSGTNLLDVRGVDRVEELLTGGAFTTSTNATEFVNTNVVSEIETNSSITNEVELIRPPFTTQIKFLQFRYWGGTNWLDSWNALELPAGIEISLGREPMTVEPVAVFAEPTDPGEETGTEVFRRVVYLPQSVPPANRVVREEPAESF